MARFTRSTATDLADRALTSQPVIEQAKGILMARHCC
jgi:AmiR/NasT family two-component response regulator